MSQKGFAASYLMVSMAIVSVVIGAYAMANTDIADLASSNENKVAATKLINQGDLLARHARAEGGYVSAPSEGSRGMVLTRYDLMFPPVVAADPRDLGIELCHKFPGNTESRTLGWFFGPFSSIGNGNACGGLNINVPASTGTVQLPVIVFPVHSGVCKAINDKTRFDQREAGLISTQSGESTLLSFAGTTSLNDSAATRQSSDSLMACAEQGDGKPSLLLIVPGN